MATMQVRGLSLASGSSSYYYFSDVTAQRAVELARGTDYARCIRVAYYEVRDDAYPSLNEPPVLVAPAFASGRLDFPQTLCEGLI